MLKSNPNVSPFQALEWDVVPQKWRIIVPIAIASGLSMFNAVKLAFSYIPSSVKTVMEFRYGTIGSLHDEDFLGLRKSVDDGEFSS